MNIKDIIKLVLPLRVFQISLNGFSNPLNESEVDQTKNIWVCVPSNIFINVICADFANNINEILDITNHGPKISLDSGIDYFLPDDIEKLKKHLSNKECKYE